LISTLFTERTILLYGIMFIFVRKYNLELPPTLYGEDLLNGNDLMTQSMDPSFLSSRLDNTDPGEHFWSLFPAVCTSMACLVPSFFLHKKNFEV
jgi:hypothetical protein